MAHASPPHDSLRRTLLLALLATCAGCSADAVSEPLPTLETPGAFVATGPNDDGSYALFRVLMALTFDNQKTVVFVFRYPARPRSLSEARALAQGNLESSLVETHVRDVFVEAGYEIVWFRTLTEEESDAVR